MGVPRFKSCLPNFRAIRTPLDKSVTRGRVGGADATVSSYAWSSSGDYTDFGLALTSGTVIEIKALAANTLTYAGGTWAATSP
jgi:hypothetical protein